jgi:P-type Na+/K+ transporter
MIPASLVVVLTITMAVGTKVMVKRNVIVRKLDSLEALGGVTNICSDKTGTLTQGKMIVRKSWIIGYGVVSIGSTSETFNPTVGDVWLVKGSPEDIAPGAVGEKIEATKALIDNPSAHSYFNVASMANVAVVSQNKEGNWEARGDPTEIAIQVFVSRFGWGRPHLMKDHDWKQLAEYPFDSTVKRMSVIFTKGHGVHDTYAFMKGAVERVLDACVKIKAEDGSGREEELTEAKKDWVIRNMDNLASQGCDLEPVS